MILKTQRQLKSQIFQNAFHRYEIQIKTNHVSYRNFLSKERENKRNARKIQEKRNYMSFKSLSPLEQINFSLEKFVDSHDLHVLSSRDSVSRVPLITAPINLLRTT